jgi:two-component system cell cycle sensor histidine kinase/response regulator CckA
MDLGVKTNQLFKSELSELKEKLESQKALVKRLRGELRTIKDQQDSDLLYKSILQTVPNVVYRLDANGKIAFINNAITSYGYDVAELINKDILEIVYPDDREKAKYILKERRTGERRTKAAEVRLLTRDQDSDPPKNDNTLIYESKTFILESEGIYKDNDVRTDNFLGTQGVASEITEQKNAERKVHRLALIVEQVSDSIIITNLEGRIEYVNQAFEKTSGYKADEVIGERINIIYSSPENDNIYKELWETIQSGNVWKGRLINRAKHGDYIHEESVFFPVKDRKGNIINYAAVQRNVTTEKSLEQQLSQAQKMEAVGQLAGGIAHDFNNYLTVINGYAELLMNKFDQSNPLSVYVKDILKSGEKAQNLTRQLLAFSRKQVMMPKIITINQTIIDTDKIIRRLIGENIELLTQLTDEEYTVKADPGQIEQILINLAINARDAIYEKKESQGQNRITISTTIVDLNEQYILTHPGCRSGKHVCLSVSDTGIGLNKDELSKIFEPFYTTKREGQGTGLGLSTVYGIVKQNEGSIYVYSEPGLGSLFKIYWPVYQGTDSSKLINDINKDSVKGTESILLVEDDDHVRNFTTVALKSMGYEVSCASNGLQALHEIKNGNKKIDMVITDSVMPKMGGKKLVKNIAEFDSSIKVLFISGYTDREIVEKGELIDGINFLQKPFSVIGLGQKIRQILDIP